MKNFIITGLIFFIMAGISSLAEPQKKVTEKSKGKEKEMFAYLEIYSPNKNKAMEVTGTVKIKLFYKEAPVTVKNFTDLATGKKVFKNYSGKEEKIEKNFYDGTIFHRIIPDFMVQGGDPTGTGRGDAGYKFDDEKEALKLKHSGPGILSMANAGPDSNGCQFFITHRSTPWLDGRNAVFGQVVEGIDLISKMGNVQRDDGDKPMNDIVLKSVRIEEAK